MAYYLENPKVNDIVVTVHKGLPGKIVEVNNKFGWIKVKFYDNDSYKTYTLDAFDRNQSLHRLEGEARADFFLRLENANVTDFWRD